MTPFRLELPVAANGDVSLRLVTDDGPDAGHEPSRQVESLKVSPTSPVSITNVEVLEKQRSNAEVAPFQRQPFDEVRETSRIGVWELDLRNETEYWSRDCFDMIDAPGFDGTLATFGSLLDPGGAEQLMESIANAIENRASFAIQLGVATERGDFRRLVCRGECEYDLSGQPKRILGTLQDFVGRRATESAGSDNELKFRATIDHLLEGCQILDSELRYVYLNPNACRHCRRTADELIGKRIQDAFPGFETTEAFAAIQRSLCDQTACEIQSQFVFPEGSIGVFDLRILPASDGVVVLSNELTERKLAEESLRQSEVKLKTAQQMAGLGVWDWDLKEKVWWSEENYRIYGRDPKTFVATLSSFLEHIPEETKAEIHCALQQAIELDVPYERQHRIIRGDGVERWLDVYGIVERDSKRRPVRMWGVCHDITDRKRSEAVSLKQTLVLEQIAAGVPLNVILQAIVDLVEDQFPGSLCSMHLVDVRRNQLAFAAGKKLPLTYIRAIENVPIGPQVGSCGTAAYLAKPVFVADIATDPLWSDYCQLALQHELRSCWSVPILRSNAAGSSTGDQVVLGTFALYQRIAAVAAPVAESILATAVHLARMAIERDRSFQIIRESEARFAAISEVTRSVTFALQVRPDSTFAIEWARPHLGMLSGYTEEDCLLHGFDIMFHPDDRARVRQFFTEIAAGKTLREEFRYYTKSGKMLMVLMHGKLLESGPQPNECLIIGGLLDITELKAAEIALRVSEERFQLALRGANDGLWDWNLKTNHIFYSPRWKSMLGYSDEQLADSVETWFRLLHPEDKPALKRQLHVFLIGPSDNFESEFRMRHQSESYRDILCRGFLLRNSRGRPVRMVGTHQDITDRKRADEELRASRQRLEALSRQLITTRESEIRHLSRELHDELGQELTLMKMSLRDIQRTSDERIRERLNENLEMIDRAVNQVRNLSLNMRPPHLDSLGLVATLHWYLRQQAKIAGFQEILKVDPPDMQIPPDLAIICFRITQEAVTNAMRHANCTSIEIELRKTDDEFYLTVRDDGEGFNVDDARQRASEGASLGIMGMQERANLAGGRTEIASVVGRGTTIYAFFPLHRFGRCEEQLN